jgi:2Fe-2S ferredoxin
VRASVGVSTVVVVHLVEAGGERRTVEGRTGQSLMRAAVSHGIDGIAADCGGCMTCATCHVFIDAQWAGRVGPPSAEEDGMLDMTAMPRRSESRLSCQIVLEPRLDGLVVYLPETQY